MKAFRFVSLAVLSLLVASSAALYAQDEKQQEDKPPRQEEPRQDETKPPRQDEAKPPKPNKDQREQEQKQQKEQEQRDMKQDQSRDQARPEDRHDNRGQQAERGRTAAQSAHIPDDKFRAHFGHSHTFRAKTVIVSGQPRFQYEGYSFELVDAWPEDWAFDDECYIDYIDGEYFLFDLLHPGVRIAVFVVM